MQTTTNLLWTSGWDSTFRLLDLLIVKKKIVQSFYMLDFRRLSTHAEILAMKKIKDLLFKKYPESKALLLKTKFYEVNDILPNEKIKKEYQRLTLISSLGSQYEWLAEFAEEHQMYDLEVSIEKGLHPEKPYGAGYFLEQQALKVKSEDGDDYYKIKNDADAFALFKYFHFPIMDFTKPDMKRYAEEKGFLDIMEKTWFCHRPLKNNVPCGICNPCKSLLKEGFEYRIPFNSRTRYYFNRFLGRG